MKILFLPFFFSLCFTACQSPTTEVTEAEEATPLVYTPEHQKIFDQLKQKDHELFSAVFDRCDTTLAKTLISEDFEFYHDQQGIIDSRRTFIMGVPNLCKMSYKASRLVSENSLRIFPLYSNGQLYGAIQSGEHQFWGEEADKPKYLTSTAIFTHLWILEANEWKLKRVLSYDHQVPEN